MTLSAKNKIAPFESATLVAIAKVLGSTERGLTGSEIGLKLGQCKIPDVDQHNTKWNRLYNAFAEFQNIHQVGNHVVIFITESLNPSSYTGDPDRYETLRLDLNAVLSFVGMVVGDDGKVRRTDTATNLDDALARSGRMKEELHRRKVHPEVIRFCDAEIIVNNYFHAVFEAMKSITSRTRNLAGVTSDGTALVDAAFGFDKDGMPCLAINRFMTDTERGEQRGFVNLLKGLYGTIRNPLGHEAKIEWEMSEHDALDILTTISLIHRKLDKASEINNARG